MKTLLCHPEFARLNEEVCHGSGSLIMNLSPVTPREVTSRFDSVGIQDMVQLAYTMEKLVMDEAGVIRKDFPASLWEPDDVIKEVKKIIEKGEESKE